MGIEIFLNWSRSGCSPVLNLVSLVLILQGFPRFRPDMLLFLSDSTIVTMLIISCISEMVHVMIIDFFSYTEYECLSYELKAPLGFSCVPFKLQLQRNTFIFHYEEYHHKVAVSNMYNEVTTTINTFYYTVT